MSLARYNCCLVLCYVVIDNIYSWDSSENGIRKGLKEQQYVMLR